MRAVVVRQEAGFSVSDGFIAELNLPLKQHPGVIALQRKGEKLGVETAFELEKLNDEGHFPKGSMGPKIEAVLQFLRSGGRRAVITNPESLPLAIEGRAGTHFVGRL